MGTHVTRSRFFFRILHEVSSTHLPPHQPIELPTHALLQPSRPTIIGPLNLVQTRLPRLHLRPTSHHPPPIARLRSRRQVPVPKGGRRISRHPLPGIWILPVEVQRLDEIREVPCGRNIVLTLALGSQQRGEMRHSLVRVEYGCRGAVEQVAQASAPALPLCVDRESVRAERGHVHDVLAFLPVHGLGVEPRVVGAVRDVQEVLAGLAVG